VRRRRLAFALALLLAVAAVAIGAHTRARGDDTDERLERLADGIVDAGVPGAIILLRDGSETWRVASGVANRASSEPVQSGDRFRIASITKTMVAVIVLELAEEGKLQLDDSAHSWLGPLALDRRITIRELLAHTSGLADYTDERFLRLAPRWSPRRLAAYAVERPRLFPPGSRFAYASTNYVLLGLIVEKAGGAPLGRLLRRRIFEPLRLRHTTFSPSMLTGSYVHGYHASQHQGIVTGHLVDVSAKSAAGAWAAGAVVSTVDDVARFFAGLLQGRLLSPALLRAMRTPVAEPRRYGLGLALFQTPCGTAWGHTGNINGHVTAAWNTRDASRQIVIFGNAFPLSPTADATFRSTLENVFCAVHSG
jgi:D-alanyl-D-alanine carboxypeptidase